MLDTVPTAEELTNLVGKSLYEIWDSLIALIDESYDMEHIWNNGGNIGFMVIFGKDERTKFEKERDCYSKETQTIYDKAQTYHDGKWMMFEPTDTALFCDFMRLLSIKRKPNR